MTTIIPGTPEANRLGYGMLARELAFELNTGMKMSNHYSPLAFAKKLGFTGRTKKDAFVWVLETFDVEFDEGSTIERALRKIEAKGSAKA